MDLQAFGWSDRSAAAFAPFLERGLEPARVIVEHRNRFHLYAAAGERSATLAGRLRLDVDEGRSPAPVVGDWVAVTPDQGGITIIHEVLPRFTSFSRKAPLLDVEQVIAANIDVVFIVTSCGEDLSPRRIERYLALAWESGAEPVLVVSKADLDLAPEETALIIENVAGGVPVLRVSSITGEGLDALRAHIPMGRTAALLGSSGVGKSTLVNALIGTQRQLTGDVRDDGKGRHTTTRRELIALPGGGVLLDTPGMRELGLWDASDGAEQVFADIAQLALSCRFSDCQHETEPGCAVRAAAESGTLDANRLSSWRKLLAELRALDARSDPEARAAAKRRARMLGRALQSRLREKYQ